MKTPFAMKTLLACLCVGAALAGAPLRAQSPNPIDRIAGVVNEDVILRSELDRAVANISAQYAGREDQLPPREVLEKQVLERLVLVKLQVARANETGVRVTDQEVDQAIAAIASQNKVTAEQLRQQVAGDGTPYNLFRDSIRDELLTQRLRQRFAQSRVSVSEAESTPLSPRRRVPVPSFASRTSWSRCLRAQRRSRSRPRSARSTA